MKIAIKANPSRGKEIISLLESFGGINKDLKGNGVLYTYYIHKNNILKFGNPPEDYKVYTLEEFEKECPFKVGDMVVTATERIPRQIIAFEYYNDKLCYTLEDGFHYKPQLLELYKEMKKERNITLTLDKAKEWYKKGGELREIALQAFTKKELNPLPRSWEEFCKDGYWHIGYPEKYKTLFKLEKLRDCWRQGWVPDYTKTYKKYRIKKLGTEYIVDWSTGLSDFLVFQTEELAEEFLKCFRDLIEQTGDLI